MKNKILIFTIFILSLTSAFGQFGNGQVVSRNFGDITEFLLADIDGDGDKDIIMASPTRNAILWVENLGNGDFSLQKTVSNNVDSVTVIFSVDMDNDGDIDVISCSLDDNKLAWFENDGNANFISEHIISNSASAYDICTYDFNEDGYHDILFVNPILLLRYKNDGQNNFTLDTIHNPHTPIGSGSKVITSDLNNDGEMDIIFSSSTLDEILWFENDGNGDFSSENLVTNNIDSPYDIHSIDLDEDGDKDILSASMLDGKIYWYENTDSQGNFLQHLISSSLQYASVVSSGDMDGDGDIDVIGASYAGGGEFILFENDGNEIFSEHACIIEGEQPDTRYLIVSDLDNDTDLDIILAGRDGGHKFLMWVENDSNLVFHHPKHISQARHSGVSLVDIDGDFDLDILSHSMTDDCINWYENDGIGNFSMLHFLYEEYLLSEGSMCAGDLDLDGKIDIAFYSSLDYNVSWLRNSGSGNFEDKQVICNGYSSDYSVSEIFMKDLDNDGDLDLVLKNSFANPGLYRVENLGNGDFSNRIFISDNFDISKIAISDIDNNGFEDIIVTSADDNALVYYANNGSFNFTEQVISDTAIGAYRVEVGDIDNDGDIDISYSASSNILWYENNGNGTFNSAQVLGSGVPFDYQLIDVDLDDDLDIVSASGNNIFWFENENCVFNNMHNLNLDILVYSGGHRFDIGDIDGDGDNDMLLSSYSYPDYPPNETVIWWHENYLYGAPNKINGSVFYDTNQNGEKDTLEYGFTHAALELNPNHLASFTSSNGNYWFAVDTGNYILTYSLLEYWGLTTDSSVYHINLESINPITDSIDFGFYPDTFITDIRPELVGAGIRCSEESNLWLNYQNNGTTNPNGIVELVLDSQITYVSSMISPDSIVGQNIYWHFDTLNFFASEQISLVVEMPDFNSMGDTLTSVLNISTTDSTGQLFFTDTLSEELECSYDPNDKLVSPRGIGLEGTINKNETLEYTIRFQNTGNAEAINIKVRDQIDENVDMGSIQILASSHELQAYIQQNRWMVFQFDSIMLPDSTVNFTESQGFVKYCTKLKDDVLPNAQIFNTANIYFDYNPAIITNTVMNTVECYISPEAPSIEQNNTVLQVETDMEVHWFLNGVEIIGATDTAYQFLVNGNYSVIVIDNNGCFTESEIYTVTNVNVGDLENRNIVVYPNPTTGYFSIEGENFEIVEIYNLSGHLILSTNKREINLTNKTKGIYFIKVTSENSVSILKLIVE